MSVGTELWLVRHGETEWSLSGAHTSRTDIPLTEHGRKRAEELRDYLKGTKFDAVFVSPMQRARETCAIAGFGDVAKVDDGLKEWDYGIYEGKTTKEIQAADSGVVGLEERDCWWGDCGACWGARGWGDCAGSGGGSGRWQGGVVCSCTYFADSGGAVGRAGRRRVEGCWRWGREA